MKTNKRTHFGTRAAIPTNAKILPMERNPSAGATIRVTLRLATAHSDMITFAAPTVKSAVMTILVWTPAVRVARLRLRSLMNQACLVISAQTVLSPGGDGPTDLTRLSILHHLAQNSKCTPAPDSAISPRARKSEPRQSRLMGARSPSRSPRPWTLSNSPSFTSRSAATH